MLRSFVSRLLRRPGPLIVALLAWALLLSATVYVLGPILSQWHTYGFHDWDVETAYRYITVLSLKEYGEAPWWHPWLCGGFPAFGHIEGATNLVSPYLPIYLLADVRTALRLEILGAAVIGLTGAYVLAGQFTRSVALRALVAALFVLNGRWALQAAVGHSWHLQYGWTPWVFYFFERAQAPGRLRMALLGGAVLALMVFLGGIYPVPHTALALGCYATLLSLFRRSSRPIAALAITGVSAFGLSAPKLFAVLDGLSRAPRLIDSKETIGLAELVVMLLNPNQSYGSMPIRVPAYGWHEWGIYIGIGGVAVLALAIVFSTGARGQALKITGLLFLLLGFGAFHADAPWALLHRLPIFSSQHVPSRFHFPMILVLSLAFVDWAARAVDSRIARRRWLDGLLLLPVFAMTIDLARVSQRPFEDAFWMVAPNNFQRAAVFEHHRRGIVNYVRRDWAAPVLLGMFANKGLIQCYGLDPRFDGVGAIPVEDKSYQGPAYFAEGTGRAKLLEWSPNHAEVRISSSSKDALVVYNMNYDPSWKANGEPAMKWKNAVATRVPAGDRVVQFRYFPRTLKYSVPICLVTLLACAIALWPDRWRRLGLAIKRHVFRK